jgi:hypothetical protein
MAESRDELTTEIAKETGLDCMGEDAEDEEEDEDANNGGGATAPPVPMPLLLHLRRSSRKALWRWFQNKKLMWRMKISW